jgi:hypothetical protein
MNLVCLTSQFPDVNREHIMEVYASFSFTNDPIFTTVQYLNHENNIKRLAKEFPNIDHNYADELLSSFIQDPFQEAVNYIHNFQFTHR